ncbi:unnamed protein product [Phytophthora fragariaefolia]|uniref:Unnamed protein product n=1 Tax=Phytophthora fragariaefolia TaxID=1490495 RepID=A0A9W6U8K4_9STRA|nr:unnamed protein product [Phytophthora fragariaefolia]
MSVFEADYDFVLLIEPVVYQASRAIEIAWRNMGLASCDAATLPGVAFFESLVKSGTCTCAPAWSSILSTQVHCFTPLIAAHSYLATTTDSISIASDTDAWEPTAILEGMGSCILTDYR